MGLTRFFVSERYRKSTLALIWLLIFVFLMMGLAWIAVHIVRETLRVETDETLAEFTRLRANVLSTFDRMDEWLVAPPCSEPYMEQLRRVAFLPDGINEFFHISDDAIDCTVNFGTLATPYTMGEPDIARDNPFGIAFWIDRDLGPLNLEGLTGTLARRGNHGMIIPAQNPIAIFPQWMTQEVVISAPDGTWWYRSGDPGLYQVARLGLGTGFAPHDGAFLHKACDPVGLHCVTSRATLAGVAGYSAASILVTFLAAAMLSALLTQFVYSQFRRLWDFEARFLRYLTQGVICTYQPIISTRTGTIAGCEVLVRWRDVDGRVIFPDEFLPIVERHNLTLRLTRQVVTRALEELETHISREGMKVSFNIFPRDFESGKLDEMLPESALDHTRFKFVVEIVETEEFAIDQVQRAIDHLRGRGIKTYIDDFGVGYSNLHNLGTLDVDGVKIDRSFAMAPENSVMARILSQAIEMAHAQDRVIVIEGVETRERLAALSDNPMVDFAQGYFISRPLDIAGFARFIERWTPFGVDSGDRDKGKLQLAKG